MEIIKISTAQGPVRAPNPAPPMHPKHAADAHLPLTWLPWKRA